VKNNELDNTGIEAILALMEDGLRREYWKSLFAAIKSGAIKELKETVKINKRKRKP
jgi:hypothetical protein